MKTYLKTYILLGLFFASLVVYWGARATRRAHRE